MPDPRRLRARRVCPRRRSAPREHAERLAHSTASRLAWSGALGQRKRGLEKAAGAVDGRRSATRDTLVRRQDGRNESVCRNSRRPAVSGIRHRRRSCPDHHPDTPASTGKAAGISPIRRDMRHSTTRDSSSTRATAASWTPRTRRHTFNPHPAFSPTRQSLYHRNPVQRRSLIVEATFIRSRPDPPGHPETTMRVPRGRFI